MRAGNRQLRHGVGGVAGVGGRRLEGRATRVDAQCLSSTVDSAVTIWLAAAAVRGAAGKRLWAGVSGHRRCRRR